MDKLKRSCKNKEKENNVESKMLMKAARKINGRDLRYSSFFALTFFQSSTRPLHFHSSAVSPHRLAHRIKPDVLFRSFIVVTVNGS
ncbi:Hypothetical predicted protein [Scomber scombrus]|uniref:Uncharacterized protein n=1 Tax=Scomber scombrus TaxID=13677 RepID=A0AAV1NB27_SCOSC